MRIVLPWPPAALMANRRAHWTAKARATKAYRATAWGLSVEAGLNKATNPTARLIVAFHPPDNRRRDCQNMPLSIKPAIDGIADAMGCDDNGFRVKFPDEFSGPVKGGSVVIEVAK